jgi:hypothetical protein
MSNVIAHKVESPDAIYLGELIEAMDLPVDDAWQVLSVDPHVYRDSLNAPAASAALVSAAEAAVRRYYCV